MIISNIHCGLGNQLFQYACARRLAHYRKTELKLDLNSFNYNKLRPYGLKYFNISAGIATRQEVEAIQYRQLFGLEKVYRRLTGEKLVNRSRWIKEAHFHFDPKILTAPNHSYLCGYWQSEKYFIEIRDILLQELTLTQSMSPFAEQYAAQIQSSNAVCVHVRRGDYLKDDNLEVCSIEYYHTAFQKLSQQVSDIKVFVFSDDPEWVTENLEFDAPRIIVTGNLDYEDLVLMSMCKHFIIANSSFSWWGAWLSNDLDKIVYAPKKWFSDRAKLSLQNTSDIIPSSWKAL